MTARLIAQKIFEKLEQIPIMSQRGKSEALIMLEEEVILLIENAKNINENQLCDDLIKKSVQDIKF